MKKILSIFILIISILAFASDDIKLSGDTLKQGGFFYIEYPANKNYTVDFKQGPKNLEAFIYKNKKYVFIPVHYSNPVGTYTLKVFDNKKEIFSHLIKLTDGNFKKSYIKVTKKMSEKRSDTNLQAGADKIAEAKKNSEKNKLWKGKFINPTNVKENSNFGAMRFVNNKVVGYHSGIDFPVPIGTPLKATNDGKVIFADLLVTTGNTLVIDHGMGIFSSYSHLSEIGVKVGQSVAKGDIVGKSGNTGFVTGPHLHFTITIGRTAINPYLFIDYDILGDK
jgi:murein DD-endopeptidase MepM/ murein hydrolase activator NlpD